MSRKQKEFDYVVVGAGSAGSALAARLCEDASVSVCVVEAGGKGRNWFIKMPAGNGFVFGNPKLDWGYESLPQPSLNNRRIYFPRGKALGGSSIMNGMIYVRGVPSDYDQWRDSGLKGWGFADLLPYFRRAQGATNRSDAWHGTSGPLITEPAANFGTLDKAFVNAAIAAGHKQLDDFNGLERTGVGRADSTVSKGIRQSSAIAYLDRPPKNLTILTERHIHRVLFEGRKAIGIRCLSGDTLRARREVILCQGAFGTPQTLMLSGIGPADHLSKLGVPIQVDLPGVGQNLADHVDVSIQYGSDRGDLSLARYQRLDKAAWLMARWLFGGRGPGAGSFFSTTLFHAFNDPGKPELQVFMTPMVIEENMSNGDEERASLMHGLGRKLLVRGRKLARPGIQIDINLERPRSIGELRLASTNPRDQPLIDPRYLSNAEDLDELIRGVKVMREVMAQLPIAQYVNGELGAWKEAQTNNEIIQAIRATAYTGHHPCSTARMGSDDEPDAVLDQHLRVRGVDSLRVCDAAAMPTQITGNLNATVIAMAEKAADMILERDPLRPEDPRRLV